MAHRNFCPMLVSAFKARKLRTMEAGVRSSNRLARVVAISMAGVVVDSKHTMVVLRRVETGELGPNSGVQGRRLRAKNQHLTQTSARGHKPDMSSVK